MYGRHRMAEAAGVRLAVLLLLFFMLLSLPGSILAVRAEEPEPAPAQEQTQPDPAGPVKTIRWKAKLTASIRIKLNGKKVKLKQGKNVVIINRRFSNTGRTGKSVALIKGKKVSIPNKYLFFVKDLCTITTEGDYTRATKENWVNRKRFPSKTPYLVWISLDKQRVNVFTGPKKGGAWKLVKTFPCSTGKAETPTTPHMNADISFKARRYKYFKNNGFLHYFTEVCGSGMHKWIGPNKGKLLGKHTASNGCIRMKEKHAIWVYETLPLLTRVVLW